MYALTLAGSSAGSAGSVIVTYVKVDIRIIAQDNKGIHKIFFSYFSAKRYVVGTHQKRPTKGLLLSTHNTGFHGEIRKIFIWKILFVWSNVTFISHSDLNQARGYKNFSCSTQLSMKLVLLINLKLLTMANSFLLNIAEHEIYSANKYENANKSWHFHIY